MGVVAILFGVAFFLKWSFENNLLGPRSRVALGIAAGLALVATGWLLRHRRDVPYLSEALTGLGLGVLYLSIYGARAVYGLVPGAVAFAGMFAVTMLGALVSALTNRQITAVLAVLGGLLTPPLLAGQPYDERNLLAYLLVLDLLVLALARFRTWPALVRVAWVGTALLAGAALAREPAPDHPLTRLALLSALFVLFLAVPLLRPIAERRQQSEIDLFLVVANAAGYFWAVYATLETWHPSVEGVYALALAVVYRLVSTDYAARVPGDEPTVMVHEGVAWTFLTIAIPLSLGGRWVTLAWAAQGVALLWIASRAATPVAAWGGMLALLLAGARALGGERVAPGAVPVWNLTYLTHLLVVVGLFWGGVLATAARPDRLGRLVGSVIRDALWLAGVLLARRALLAGAAGALAGDAPHRGAARGGVARARLHIGRMGRGHADPRARCCSCACSAPTTSRPASRARRWSARRSCRAPSRVRRSAWRAAGWLAPRRRPTRRSSDAPCPPSPASRCCSC